MAGPIRNVFRVAVFSAGLTLLQCTSLQPVASGGTGSETVIGSVVNEDGSVASATAVTLIPGGYNPAAGKPIPAVCVDTTDANGKYTLHAQDTGTYNITAVQVTKRTRLLIRNVQVKQGSTDVPVAVLHQPGSIEVVLSASVDSTNGYFYIPGTNIYSLLNAANGCITLDSVPSGSDVPLYYSIKNNAEPPRVIRDSIAVTAGTELVIGNVDWAYSRKLILNTTASGAAINRMVTNFPVLIRLNSADFPFSQAKSGGEDLRFAKSDGSPLSYQIERWDAGIGQAEIWVKVDTVFGNDSTHFITMYWGNSNAVSASNGAGTFDTADGFQGVWHLNDPVSGPVKDATINGYDGTPVNATAFTSANAMVGVGREFAPTDSGYVILPGTAQSKLNFNENGIYTVSAWVYLSSLDSVNHAIATKGDQQYNLEVFSNDWEFAEYKTTKQWEWSRSPATAQQWSLVTGVRNGSGQFLYVNGSCVDSTIDIPAVTSASRNTGYSVMFGRTDGYPQAGFPYYFHGALDEIRFLNRAPNADWIKLCYMNQKNPDALVEFK